MNWYVSLKRNCGRLTASPMAVRLCAALNPTMPSSVISSEGIVSEVGSNALVVGPQVGPRARATSFEMFCPSTLFSQTLNECWFDVTAVVSPGGVTWRRSGVIRRSVDEIAAGQNVIGGQMLVDTAGPLIVIEHDVAKNR